MISTWIYLFEWGSVQKIITQFNQKTFIICLFSSHFAIAPESSHKFLFLHNSILPNILRHCLHLLPSPPLWHDVCFAYLTTSVIVLSSSPIASVLLRIHHAWEIPTQIPGPRLLHSEPLSISPLLSKTTTPSPYTIACICPIETTTLKSLIQRPNQTTASRPHMPSAHTSTLSMAALPNAPQTSPAQNDRNKVKTNAMI